MTTKDCDMISYSLSRVKTGKSWKDSVTIYTAPAKTPAPAPAPVALTANDKQAVKAFEDMRRDKIIKYQVQQSGLAVGMRVKPADASVFATSGPAVITSIATSYKDYATGRDESDWPKNDMPFIVHARYENGDSKIVTATFNYFIPISSS